VFAGGWTLDAAEEVCMSGNELGIDLLDGLSSLSDQSLVRAQDDEDEPRFTMLQVIREFAAEKLESRGEADAVRRRHAEHMFAFAVRAGPELTRSDLRDWNHRLRRDEENLRSAYRWALEAPGRESGLRAAAAMWRYWHYWGAPREGRDWVGALLEAQRASASDESTAMGLSALASLVYWLGEAARADDLYLEATAIYRQLADAKRVAETVEASSWAAIFHYGPQVAMARGHEAMELYRALGDRAGVARVNAWLKVGALLMGAPSNADEALAAAREALAAAHEAGDTWDEANWKGSVADIYRRMGDLPRALEESHETLELYHSLGYLAILPWLKVQARIELDLGKVRRAATLAAIAERAVEDLGGDLPEAMTLAGKPLEEARSLMSDDDYASAVAKGRAMDFEEAISFALEK
jgi:tetratricopeptide (TPR) repeat protein